MKKFTKLMKEEIKSNEPELKYDGYLKIMSINDYEFVIENDMIVIIPYFEDEGFILLRHEPIQSYQYRYKDSNEFKDVTHFLTVVSGTVEKGELLKNTVRRELYEETGVVLSDLYDFKIDKDFSLKMKSVYHDWELEKDRYIGHWDYSSWSSYNELELHMFENSKSSNIFGVSYEVGAARRYKSEKGAYDVGASNQKTHNYSVYDNGNFALNESWNFVYGGRYFFSDYYDRLEREDVHNDNFSVRTGVLYSVQNNMTLKTLYSQAYRVPTYFEKEVNSATVKGNPNLSSEKSESYDLIFVHQLESFNYTADLFYTKIKDKISRVDIGGGIKQNKNDGDIDYYGLELNTKFRIDETLWGFAGYSYTQSANEDNKALEDFVYDNMFTAALSKKAFSDFTFNTAIKYMDSWAEADSYFLMNLSADYAVPSVQGLSFELIATNIFNEDIDVPEIARDAPEVETVPEDQSSRFYFGMKYLF